MEKEGESVNLIRYSLEVIGIKTYQDLEALGEDQDKRREFVRSAVSDHKTSENYKIAADAELYYAKKNPTITKYQKFIYNSLGQSIPDIWSANYKLIHGFFHRFVLQQVQYVLSNGVSFEKKNTKERLGLNFDRSLVELAKAAMKGGVAFGFWNFDHLEVFPFVDTPKNPGFAPLYDEETGLLRAGVRYWVTSNTTERYTLYEEEGYTEYIRRDGGDMVEMRPQASYKRITRKDSAAAVETGENYPGFPIIQMYANDLEQSEIIGIRSSIDCYDFISSGMANNVDETSAFYWTLKNTGGMDDADLVEFVNRMKQLKAAVLDRNVEVEAHTMNVPVEANEKLLDRLRSDMYEDFMLLDTEKALSGNMTATAIRLSYQAQDDKCGDFEYCIREFIGKLLELLGIKDEPSFKWNRIANQTEETQMVMMAATELDSEAILNHLPWITPEEADAILKRRAAEDLGRFDGNGPQDGTEGNGSETD